MKDINTKTKQAILEVPQDTQGHGKPYKIPYYFINGWLDNDAGEPQDLLNFVVNLKNTINPNDKNLIAVHCSSGVSRTGTMIAAYLLINEIDAQIKSGIQPKNINISIEKTVLQLSLQRPYAVGKPMQYVTLYRIVDLYMGSTGISVEHFMLKKKPSLLL